MGAVDTTYTFTATDTITSTKMNNIIDQTTMTTDAIIGTTLDVASGKLKVRSAGITSNEMGANSVVTAAITDSNVTTAKIADSNVTQAKFAPNVAGNGPTFHVTMGNTNQTITNDGVPNIVRFNTEVFDIGSCFNTSNYRFMPNVAGFYQINLTVQVDGSGSQLGTLFATIRKNGSTLGDIFIFNINNNFSVSSSGSIIVALNGTSDYVDAHVSMSGGPSNAYIVGPNTRTYMSGFLARSA